MKKRLITLLIPLLLLSLAFIPQTAQAKPDSIDCIHNPVCLGSTYWNGANYGGFTTVTISVPGMRTSPAYWQRFFRVSGNVTSDYPRIEVGESVTSGSGFGTFCAGAGLAGITSFTHGTCFTITLLTIVHPYRQQMGISWQYTE